MIICSFISDLCSIPNTLENIHVHVFNTKFQILKKKIHLENYTFKINVLCMFPSDSNMLIIFPSEPKIYIL